MLRTRERSRGGNGSGGGAVAEPLPATSLANMMYLGDNVNAGNYTRFDLANAAIPAGDWLVSFEMYVPTQYSATNTGAIFSGSASNYTSNNGFHIYYEKADGTLSVSGCDAAGNTLGVFQFPKPDANVTPVGLKSNCKIPVDRFVKVLIQKAGTSSQMWLQFDGHTPMKVCEGITSMGAVTSLMKLGVGVDHSNPFRGRLRNFMKLSYSLTEDQIYEFLCEGVNPLTLGTPAADDYLFTLSASSNPITSTINSVTMSRVFNNTSVATGFGWAPQTDGVYLDPVGVNGIVVQHQGGSAAVSLSGRYAGADGSDIEIQFLNESYTAFSGWVTVDTAVTGGTWSGTVVIPKGKRWVRAQIRKTSGGVPSTDVMTTTLDWGVGVNIMLSGQSLMEHMGSTSAAYGSTTLTPNGYVSFYTDVSPQITFVAAKQVTITGATNDSGRIKLSFGAGGHGQWTGKKVYVNGVVGTTEANGYWTVTAPSRTELILDGSVFTNAYVSGGALYIYNHVSNVMNKTFGDVLPDGHIAISNYVSNSNDCVVALTNQSAGGQAINQFFNFTQTGGLNCFGTTAALATKVMPGGLGVFAWLQGHQNIGQFTQYPLDLETLYQFNLANFNQTNMKFGVAAFTSVAGQSFVTPSDINQFRFCMKNYVDGKIAGGDNNVFFLGFYNDCQPQWENGTSQNAHLTPTLKGYLSQAARIGHAISNKFGGASNSPVGPKLGNGTRSGAVLTIPVTHNGGSLLKVLRAGAQASGFEFSTATNFSSLLTVNYITLNANNIVVTLSSDPGAPVYFRYQYGRTGNVASGTYGTIRITGVADNGAGLVRVTAVNTGLSPSSSNKATPFAGLNGAWVGVEGAKVSGTGVNGVWQLAYVNDTTADLVGSDSSVIGTFTAGQNQWQSSATGVVALELGVPIYDDRTIGGIDTNGAPLAPTETYLTAS